MPQTVDKTLQKQGFVYNLNRPQKRSAICQGTRILPFTMVVIRKYPFGYHLFVEN